jgi:hypothetical protein
MHLEDISSIQVAKEIVNKNLCQQVILIATIILSDIVRQETSSAGLNNYGVFTKPLELLSFYLWYALVFSRITKE